MTDIINPHKNIVAMIESDDRTVFVDLTSINSITLFNSHHGTSSDDEEFWTVEMFTNGKFVASYTGPKSIGVKLCEQWQSLRPPPAPVSQGEVS